MNANNTFRGAIIGAGNMGRSQALAFQKVNRAKITALFDVVPQQAERLAGEIGADVFTDYGELLRHVDFVVLCTPPTQRLELVRQAVHANIPLLLEKPLAGDYATAQEIVALTKGGSLPVRVGYCHRFVPAVRELLRIKGEGTYGKLRFLSQSFISGPGGRALRQSWMSDPVLSGGGVIMDTLCHSIDLTQFLGGAYTRESAVIQYDWEGRAETAASIQAITEEDVLVEVRGAWNYPISRFDLKATFERAEVSYLYGDPYFVLHAEGAEPCQHPVATYFERVVTQAEAFIDLLEGNDSDLCTVEEALQVSRVTEACYRQNEGL